MNNKGQTVVIFALLLPIFLLLFAVIFDSSLIVSENVKMKSISKEAINYLMINNRTKDDVRKFIAVNDKDVEIIDITNNEIHLKKEIESYFGKIIGYETYELEHHFIGNIINGELTINEKGN